MSNNNDSNTQSTENNAQEVQNLDELKAQVEKYKNEYLYLRAEFENYKRMQIKERSDIIKYGSERLITDILSIVDNFERALATKVTPETLDNFMKGIQMTSSEILSLLSKNHVTEIETLGKPFDPLSMEALSSEPTQEVAPGHVSRVFKKAYKLHDRVIRPAQVVVAQSQN